jgi:hypothetical protein
VAGVHHPGDVLQEDHFFVVLKQNMTTCPGRNYTYSASYYLPSNNILYPLFELGPTPDDATSGTYITGDQRGMWSTVRGNFVAKGSRVEFRAGFDARNGVNEGDFMMDRIVVKAI